MATKRPPSSRTMKPPSQTIQRSRSALARPVSTISPTTDNLEGSSTSKLLQRSAGSRTEEAETNIQVVVRCRRRSDREVQDNSPIIVSSSGAKSKDVSIETSTPVSSLGVVTLPPQRTYPFDVVFGPEADQAMVYHEVVSPMLEEVLMGYNCTLFAYGQTGTGKTYTMQGDLAPTPMGNPSAHAGMIPRVLFRLFHQLETSKTDYSVKISYIELYNEELRDLLANELSAPSGSAQPMAMASSKDPKNPPDNGLKIFDDASKRGIVIQGLEEISVKDCKDALALLTKGSQRRQIAATKFNDHSSRSHSVFSITVHIKETSSMGDDLLKVGKLNLVDLAGSENIGRSGAENKRAREAGMINQSLLTLGRVINALVDRSSHVPYRESKLTRLLQDSLGGRTKTCIIATISPARSNMEETLSTLDYALRAKSIRNKPEVNQRMTRNSLLKEYVAEIERLKADLLAAREKNGIFFSEETWEEMTKEQELSRTEREEAIKQVEIVEGQLRAVREEFEQSIALLMRRDQELKQTRSRLQDTERVLQVKEGELKVVKVALEEEVVVREAHQTTEDNLDKVASRLRNVVEQSVGDVGGLFDKLVRKSAVLKSNSQAVSSHGKTIASTSSILSDQLNTLITSSTQHITQLRLQTQELETRELKLLSSYSSRVERQIAQTQNILSGIRAKDAAEEAALRAVQQSLADANDTLTTSLGGLSNDLIKTCENICSELKTTGMTCFAQLETTLLNLGSYLEAAIREVQEYIVVERASLKEVSTLASHTVENECSRLREQNNTLMQLLAQEQKRSQRAKEDLVHNFSTMLSDFLVQRQSKLQEMVQKTVDGNSIGGDALESFGTSALALMSRMDNKGTSVANSLTSVASEGKQAHGDAVETITENTTTFAKSVSRLQEAVSSSSSVMLSRLDKDMSELHAGCSNGFEQHGRAKRARLDTTSTLAKDLQSTFKSVQDGFLSTSKSIENMSCQTSSKLNALENSITSFHHVAASHLASQHQATIALIQEGNREDVPTGTTPRKRKWVYDSHWQLTGRRSDVLSTWRKHARTEAASDTFVARHLSLPEDAEDQTDQESEADADTTARAIYHSAERRSPEQPSQVPSLVSSTSSLPSPPCASTPPDHDRPMINDREQSTSKQMMPSAGTLVNSRTSNIATRSRRRR